MKLLFGCVFILVSSLKTCSGLSFRSIPSIEVEDQQSCCSLKWMKFEDENVIKIAINFTNDDEVRFFAKNDDVLRFVKRSELFASMGETPNILANPHNCSLRWINHTASNYKSKQPHLYLPTVNNLAFSISIQTEYYDSYDFRVNRSYKNHKIAEFADIFGENSGSIQSTSNCNNICQVRSRKLLFVDCMKSMKNVLRTELRLIQLNESSLLTNSVKVDVKSQSLYNGNDYNVTYKVGMYEPVLIRFDLQLDNYSLPFTDYLKHGINLEQFKKSNSGSILQKIYELPQIDPLLLDIHSLGKISTGPSTFLEMIFDQEVDIPAKSLCVIKGQVTSFSGQEPVDVSFEIVPIEGFEEHWTSKQILSSLQASSVDTSQLIEEDNKLIFRYSGTLKVNSVTDEKVQVSCVSKDHL